MKKKVLALAAAVAILAIATVGASLAWFTDTAEAANTFTVGNVSIALDEAKVDEFGKKLTGGQAERVSSNSYPIVPGDVLDKDPTVTVNAGSAACYVFVRVDNQLSPYATLDIDKDWVPMDGDNYPGLYRYKVVVSGADQGPVKLPPVFEHVTIQGKGLSNETLKTLKNKKVAVTAFAIQADNIDPKEAILQAWETLTQP